MATRLERDSLGTKRVPASAYYGIQTFRAVENFPISGLRLPPEMIRAYALIKKGEAWLLSCHISPYSHSGYASHDPLRTRKLLLRREQIDKLRGRVEEKGLALVPVRLYFKNGRAKCELALVKGKKVWDRREEIRRRADDREIEQELKRYR